MGSLLLWWLEYIWKTKQNRKSFLPWQMKRCLHFRKFCNQSTWLFALSAGILPAPWSMAAGSGIACRGNQPCDEPPAHPTRESHISWSSLTTEEFTAVIIIPDFVWSEHKGKYKKNLRKSLKNLVTKSYASKCLGPNGSEIKMSCGFFASTSHDHWSLQISKVNQLKALFTSRERKRLP